MSSELLRVKAKGHAAHCRKLLTQLADQPGYIQAMPMVKNARVLAGQSIELAEAIQKLVPAQGGEHGNEE